MESDKLNLIKCIRVLSSFKHSEEGLFFALETLISGFFFGQSNDMDIRSLLD